ncbi:hypothetical protein [Streptomyces niveus]|uniref:hypothetical protein n=1 Tax=Streptomyces niveus TaxID=193462 RepID=UPI00342C34B4
MPHDLSFTSRSLETAAREGWADAVNLVEKRTADYLTVALPGLEANRAGGKADPTCLSLELPGGGNVLVITSPKYATLHGAGLHWEVWSLLVEALYGGEHFALSDTDGAETEDPHAAAPGSYTDDSDRDSLIVRENGTADVSIYDLGIGDMAQILASIRDGLTQLRQLKCTRCHLVHWRHTDPKNTDKSVCDSFTLACPDCLQHAASDLCTQARTRRPCTRKTARAQAHQAQGAADVLELLTSEFNGWDLAAIAHYAVERFGEYGEVNDHLSESQKDVLGRAATFFGRIGEPA